MATRWGICGGSKIAADFCLCLKSLPSTEHQIVAVAARDKGRAEAFAARFDIPQSYGSYEELAGASDVDVVYVATYNTTHAENSLLFINAGKNVLSEKPISMTLEGCKKVLAAAKEKNVLFLDGIWSKHFPLFKFITEQIESGALGDVIMVQATFCGRMMDVPRAFDPSLGGGSLMEMGVYPVMLANHVFKGNPEQIIANGNKTDKGVDLTNAILLRYPGGKFAMLACSFEASKGASSMVIRGSKGNLSVPDRFWCADKVVLDSGEVKHFPFPEVNGAENLTYWNTQGLTYEAQEVRSCLLKGLKESPFLPHEDSLTIMTILDEVQKQLGLKFNFL